MKSVKSISESEWFIFGNDVGFGWIVGGRRCRVSRAWNQQRANSATKVDYRYLWCVRRQAGLSCDGLMTECEEWTMMREVFHTTENQESPPTKRDIMLWPPKPLLPYWCGTTHNIIVIDVWMFDDDCISETETARQLESTRYMLSYVICLLLKKTLFSHVNLITFFFQRNCKYIFLNASLLINT